MSGMRQLLVTLGPLGLFCVAVSATAGAALFGWSSALTWVPGVGGACLIAAAGLARLRGGTPGFAVPIRLTAELVACVLLGAGALALSAQMTPVVDVTHARVNTLSEASVAVAHALAAPVTIEARLEADDRTFVELSALVARYQRETPQLALQRFAPDARGADGAMLPRVSVRSTDAEGTRALAVRFIAGAPDQEEQLTNALRATTAGGRARLYVVGAAGLSALSSKEETGLLAWRDALRAQGVDMTGLPLGLMPDVPDDARAVALITDGAVPLPPFAAEDLDKLGRYLTRGGRLLLMLEPNVDGGLVEFAARYLATAQDNIVIDPSAFAGVLGGRLLATGTHYDADHPVTARLAGNLTHFQRARALVPSPHVAMDATSLVRTDAASYALDPAAAESLARDGAPQGSAPVGARGGPLTLAMALSGTGPRGARAVVFGDATCAQNGGIGLGANRDLVVNATLWLMEDGDRIAIRPSQRSGALLLLTPSAKERLAALLVYGLPGLLVLGGQLVRMRRRR